MNNIAAICAEREIEAAEAKSWAHLLPLGEIEGRDSRRFRLSDPDAVIDAFRRHDGPIVVDYEHASAGGERAPAPAAGWIADMEIREDGVWGLIDWTPKARNMVAAREYRYLSPEELIDPQDGEIKSLRSAGLTHQPNRRLTALNRREAKIMPDNAGQLRAAVCEALGVEAGADDGAILAAVAALKENPDPARFMPVEAARDLLADRNRRIATQAEEEAGRLVDGAVMDGYITPAMRGWATALCRSDPASFRDFMASSAPQWAHLFKESSSGGEPPRAAQNRLHTGGDAASIARQLGVDPKDLA
ncbi:MAG: phage protease [Pikeienuella sp.]